MKTKIFPLTHLVLYSKGWYKQTDNIWDDLKIILEMDGYTPFSNGDVYNIILNNFDRFDSRESELSQVLTGIHPRECWKHGYYTKHYYNPWRETKNLPDYDMPEAFIKYVISSLMGIYNNQWKAKLPDYIHHKELRPDHITINKLYKCFVQKQSN